VGSETPSSFRSCTLEKHNAVKATRNKNKMIDVKIEIETDLQLAKVLTALQGVMPASYPPAPKMPAAAWLWSAVREV
jgi:hypothetical protein